MDSQVNVSQRLLKFVLFAYAAMAGGTVYAIKGLFPATSPVVNWTLGFVLCFLFLAPALRLWASSRGHRSPPPGRLGLAVMQGSFVVAFIAWVWMVVAFR